MLSKDRIFRKILLVVLAVVALKIIWNTEFLMSYMNSLRGGVGSGENKYNTTTNPTPNPTPTLTILPPPANQNIPINLESAYVDSDIVKIAHLPAEGRIHIHLEPKTKRRCQNPDLMGRISGWSLSTIDFEDTLSPSENDLVVRTYDNSTDVLVGVYDRSSMPVSGTYYLEIIILLCEQYSEEDFRNICLESPVGGANRITHTNASVHIQIEEEEAFPLVARSPKGLWLHKSLVDTNTGKEDRNNAMVPLYTRHFPKECHDMNPKRTESRGKPCQLWSMFCMLRKSAFCMSVMGHSQFRQYTYHWSDGPHEMLNRQGIRSVLETYGQNSTANSSIVEPHRPTNVCFVGASHAATLAAYCETLLRDSPDISSLSCDPKHKNFATPSVILKKPSLPSLVNCTHVVIGLFQHPFSYLDRTTANFSDWKRDMTSVVEMFKSFVASPKNKLEKILLRSAHPNVMGFLYHRCPAEEFRTVPNAKMATSLLKEIVETYATNEDGKEVLSLVDTSFLIDPVWDSAADGSHYRNEAGLVETKYILWKILSEG